MSVVVLTSVIAFIICQYIIRKINQSSEESWIEALEYLEYLYNVK